MKRSKTSEDVRVDVEKKPEGNTKEGTVSMEKKEEKKLEEGYGVKDKEKAVAVITEEDFLPKNYWQKVFYFSFTSHK